MEDLFGFILVILAIVSAINKNNKKKQQTKGRKASTAKPQTEVPSTMEALQAWFEEETEEKAAETAKPAVPTGAGFGGSIREITHEGVHPCDEHTSAPKQVVQPRIKSRVQVTERPQVVLGSMGVDSHEGIHPCDEHEDDLRQDDKPLVAMPVEKPGIQLDWTGDNMVKAFIMQEVLTRPGQRRRV